MDECWCGTAIQAPANNTPVADSDCNKRYTGGPNSFCGSGGRVYLYEHVKTSVPWIEMGCYAEQNPRILHNLVPVVGGKPNNTPQNCILACDKEAYSYRGVEDGDECGCDNQINGTLRVTGQLDGIR